MMRIQVVLMTKHKFIRHKLNKEYMGTSIEMKN